MSFEYRLASMMPLSATQRDSPSGPSRSPAPSQPQHQTTVSPRTTTPKPEPESAFLPLRIYRTTSPPLFPLIPSFPTRTFSKPRNLENLVTHHTSAQAGNSTPRPLRERTTDREDRTSSYPVGPYAGRQASLRGVCSPGWRLGFGGRGG